MIAPVVGQVYVTVVGQAARQVVSCDNTHVALRAYPHGKVVWRIKRSSFTKVYRWQTARDRREQRAREQGNERRGQG